jgi:PAS domain-containing protein
VSECRTQPIQEDQEVRKDAMRTLPALETVAALLDSLNIGCCVFDAEDSTLLWNRSMLVYFPEHAGHVHVGEAYRANLQRFYEKRLNPQEMPRINQYIEAGIKRHQSQQRPFNFQHNGIWLTVASLPLPDGGRIRVWTRLANALALDDEHPALSTLLYASILESPKVVDLFECMADGIMIVDQQGKITSVNNQFAELYSLKEKNAVVGLRFEDVFELAWREHSHDDNARYQAGALILAENMRFSGAPFELPLPAGCWVRVLENSEPGGSRFSSHVNVTAIRRDSNHLA